MNNVVAYSIQVLILVAGAAIGAWLFRLEMPKAKLWFWQGVLAICLLLPVVQPRRVTTIGSDVPQRAAAGTPVPFTPAESRRPLPIAQIASGIYFGGVSVRLAWLLLGGLRLRKYRRDATEFYPPNRAVAQAAQELAPSAAICVSFDISAPVTFGAVRPVVLLPPNFSDLDPGIQEAIVVHELVHVRRRDWLFTVSEEIVRSVLWFHPGIWWLLAQIQLAREQVVDRATIEFTSSREQYLQALLAIAQTKVRPDLALAPLFLRKRHLARRVGALTKDIQMSKRKLALSLATVSTLALVTARVAVLMFPMQSFAQEAPPGSEVSIDLRGQKLLHGRAPSYPLRAMAKGVEGTVSLLLTVDGTGEVLDARAETGPEELRASALAAALQWRLEAQREAGTKSVSIVYKLSQAFKANPLPPFPAVGAGATIRSIDVSRVPENLRLELRRRLSVREGDPFTSEAMRRVQEEIRGLDEHLSLGLSVQADQSADLVIAEGAAPAQRGEPFNPPPTPGVNRLRVPGEAQATRLVDNPPPDYPALAKLSRIQGSVRLNGLIGPDGSPKQLNLISGHPLLAQAAISAVRNWKYEPLLANGAAAEVITTIDVNFTLSR